MKKYQFIICLIVLMLLKIFVVQVQPIKEEYTMKYDDLLMVNMANNILEGKWLGEYNDMTLIKGVFTPLFIASMNILNIPFLLGKEILYGMSCITFILIIKKKIKNKLILFLLYIILIFNPVEYSAELSRVYRDGIYMSLVLFLFSFMLGIFLSKKEEIKKQLKYFIGFGISFTACFLCREENIWLLPFILFMIIFTIIPVLIDKEIKNKFRRILLYLIPICILGVITNVVCMINYKYYGIYLLNQYWGKPFESAYGALTRIKPQEDIKRVPVTKESMNKVYEKSPKFAELKEYFEGYKGKGWSLCGESINNEINGGYFHWALMDAVKSKGYYKDAKTANTYYLELAEEINMLCDIGALDSRCEKRISNTCYFDVYDILDVIEKMPKVIKYQYTLKDVNMEVEFNSNLLRIEGMNEKKELFEKITKEELITREHYESELNKIRLNIIEYIKNIYSNFNSYIFYISIMCFMGFIMLNLKKINKKYDEIVLLVGIFILYITRIFIITFTSELMYKEALNISYLASIYNMQFLFGTLSIVFLLKHLVGSVKNRKNIHKS